MEKGKLQFAEQNMVAECNVKHVESIVYILRDGENDIYRCI